MLRREEEEQALHLDARAVLEELVDASGDERRESFEDLVRVVEALVFGNLIKEFEHGALRRGEGEGPSARTRRAPEVMILVDLDEPLVPVVLPRLAGQAVVDRFVPEQGAVVVVLELSLEREFVDPGGRGFRTVEVDGGGALLHEVGEALQLERAETSDVERVAQQHGLKRDHGLLPSELADLLLPLGLTKLTPVDAPGDLLDAPRGDVVTDQAGGVSFVPE